MANVLVIDDDRSVPFLIERAVQGTGVNVLPARSVQEGLDLLERRPDVVLLDIMLPEGSGLEAVRKIQDRDPKLPIIFITAGGTSDTTIEAMKLGAYDYLLKPLDLPKLRELGRTGPRNPPPDAGPRRTPHQRRSQSRRRPHHRPQPRHVRGL